jgi:hypothetical protein
MYLRSGHRLHVSRLGVDVSCSEASLDHDGQPEQGGNADHQFWTIATGEESGASVRMQDVSAAAFDGASPSVASNHKASLAAAS